MMKKPYTKLILVFGCGVSDELDARLDLALNVYDGCCKRGSVPYVFMTGTGKEVAYMRSIMENRVRSWTLAGEDKSKDTIDNVVNSFGSIFNLRYGAKYYFDDGSSVDAFPFGEYHIVSSLYHLERIKCILDTLGYVKDEKVFYHGSQVYDSKRLQNENTIRRNLEEYREMILSRIKERKYEILFSNSK